MYHHCVEMFGEASAIIWPQLAVGGRLFVVVGEPPVMDARLIRRITEDAWGTESLFETVIDPLVHATLPQGFVF